MISARWQLQEKAFGSRRQNKTKQTKQLNSPADGKCTNQLKFIFIHTVLKQLQTRTNAIPIKIFLVVCPWVFKRKHFFSGNIIPDCYRWYIVSGVSFVTSQYEPLLFHVTHAVQEGTPSKSKSLLSLHWHHNERDGVSNHQRLDCFLNVCSGVDKTPKLCVAGFCESQRPKAQERLPYDDVMISGRDWLIVCMFWMRFAAYLCVINPYLWLGANLG